MAKEPWMLHTQPTETRQLSLGEQEVTVKEVRATSGWSYEMKMGRETIWLDPIEYGILTFLAKRPYHAYTPVQIADAVSSDECPLTTDTLDGHIASLRDKLGFFRDYIQTVPYTGYRFKE